MNRPNVEDLDDEELLDLYESTRKLYETRKNQDHPPGSNKINTLLEKLSNIEEELKIRSLWDDK